MTRFFYSSLLLLAVWAGIPSSWADAPPLDSPLNLSDCYKAALKQSEAVATQTELLVQAEERLRQAKGAVWPTINGSATFLRQPSSAPGASGLPAISQTQQNTVSITGDQPIFRGFREFAGIKQTRLQTSAQAYARDQAAAQLYSDTAQAFYTILLSEKDIANLKDEIQANVQRVNDLNQFRRIGRAQASDVLAMQANLASLRAQLAGLYSSLRIARETWAFLTGLSDSTPLQDTEPGVIAVGDPSQYLVRIDSRPDVKSAMDAAKAAEESVSVAQGAHLPSADLLGNYYLVRPGYLSYQTWSVELAISLPIFQGGIIQSQVRQAASVQRQEELALSVARRTAEEQIRGVVGSLTYDQEQVDQYRQASEVAAKAYHAMLKNYRYGLNTNLDVLQALTASQEDRRALDRQIFTQKFDRIRLDIATALRPRVPDENKVFNK